MIRTFTIKNCVAYIFMLLIGVNGAFAQKKKSKSSNAEERQNVVKIAPLGLLAGFYTVSYERVLSERFSGVLTVSIFAKDYTKLIAKYNDDPNADVTNAVVKFSGFSIIPEGRMYFGKKGAPRGFYLGAFLPIQKFTLKASGDIKFENELAANNQRGKGSAEVSVTNVGLGVMIGAQGLIAGRVSIDPFLGVGLGYYALTGGKAKAVAPNSYTEEYDFTDDVPSNFKNTLFPMIRLGLNIGVAF